MDKPSKIYAEYLEPIKVDESTLDEAPGAYKDIYEVMELQKDLVDVIHHVKPIINIKA